MDDDPISLRLTTALADLERLRGPIHDGGPWPLADRWDDAPETHWGPPEVLAHVAEMIDYWDGELSRIAASDGSAPVPFGRVATDTRRLSQIEAGRLRPTGDLLDDVATLGATFANHWAGWSPAERTRVGIHPTRGEFTVEAGAVRFIVGHLEEHVVQLRTLLDATSTPG